MTLYYKMQLLQDIITRCDGYFKYKVSQKPISKCVRFSITNAANVTFITKDVSTNFPFFMIKLRLVAHTVTLKAFYFALIN